jgi:acetoin utilization deacetylase AcuC-like enzyme
MHVSRQGYTGMSHVVRALADELCGGRCLFVLEGGYAAEGLYEGTAAVLEALLAQTALPPGTPELEPGSLLDKVLTRVTAVHGTHYPGLGSP